MDKQRGLKKGNKKLIFISVFSALPLITAAIVLPIVLTKCHNDNTVTSYKITNNKTEADYDSDIEIIASAIHPVGAFEWTRPNDANGVTYTESTTYLNNDTLTIYNGNNSDNDVKLDSGLITVSNNNVDKVITEELVCQQQPTTVSYQITGNKTKAIYGSDIVIIASAIHPVGAFEWTRPNDANGVTYTEST
ncbi:MAG: hypothetical protein LBM72_03205, partial [Mycoplasmataceae bacterium]|nr:hypothetical protein [Mycoplasmataceae bacterium]